MPARKRVKRGRSAKRSKSRVVKSRAKRASSKTSRRSKRLTKRQRMSVSSVQLPMDSPRTMTDVKFNSYIKKMLKSMKGKSPRVKAIDSASTKCIDSLLKDTLHQIATQASVKMGKKKTLKPKQIARAMKRVLPKTMLLKVDAHAQKALERYSNKKSR